MKVGYGTTMVTPPVVTKINFLKIFPLLLFFLVGLFYHQSVTAADPNVHEFHLNNGLKLIVKEDHRAPVVMSQIWYKVGSSYEYSGITGISHVVEHMMFKGTSKYPAGAFSQIIAMNGGKENASTSYDFTYYFQELSADKLSLSFELEADRMQNLSLRPEEFAKEIQVVISERHMRTDDNPQGIVYERFAAAANIATTYHHPIIGWLNDLLNLSVNDVKRWYATWYAPNNATLVVVGDVNPSQVAALAQKYFGAIPPVTLPKVKPQTDIKPLGEKYISVKTPAKLPWIVMGYNVPVVVTTKEKWQPYALAVLNGILDGGSAARLQKELVRKQQVASSVSASYDPFSRLDALFTLDGTPSVNHSVRDVELSFREQIKQLQNTLVSDEELARVKIQVIANKQFDKDSISSQAEEIGALESVGLSWQEADKYVENIQAITPQQIQTVAKLYLTPDRLTIAVLDPLPLAKGKTETTPAIGGQNVR